MINRFNPYRSAAKSSKIEDCDPALIFAWDTDIGDPINFILKKKITTEILRKVLTYAKDHLKIMSAEKDGDNHKLQ